MFQATLLSSSGVRKNKHGKVPVTHRISKKRLSFWRKILQAFAGRELLTKIKAADPTFHPKTVNGCVWKLVERFPDKVYKPSKGLFRLRKSKSY